MVHQYRLHGYNLALDVFSGSVHVMDDVAYDMLSLWTDHTPEEIGPLMKRRHPSLTAEELEGTRNEIRELIDAGKLFTEDDYSEMASGFKARRTGIKALCLHVAHTCNLNCAYCFAAQGKYHGDRAVMSFETGKRALDFLVEHSGAHRNLEVDFFGGEPLMNFDVVRRLTAYARGLEKPFGKNFRFTLTTNGMLLDDEVIAFANRECENVVLSLDGRKATHDAFRTTVGGKGSYDVIVPKFQKFAEARGDREYYVRGTYTRRNLDFTEDIFHMIDLGFTRLSMEPVVCDPGEPYALRPEDIPFLCGQYEILADAMLKRRREGKPVVFYHYMIDLEGGPCIYKRVTGCGCGTEYLAVTPWGDLYPCHQFVGDERFRIGDLRNGITNTALQKEFRSCSAYARPECRNCWALLYCSGGCAANAFHATGSVRGIYPCGCELFKKRIECAIMLKAAEAMDRAGGDRPSVASGGAAAGNGRAWTGAPEPPDPV